VIPLPRSAATGISFSTGLARDKSHGFSYVESEHDSLENWGGNR
jgi:hypothetical protein